MKLFVAALSAIFLSFLPGMFPCPSHAGAVKEYGPSYSRFSVEVPSGWTATAIGDGSTSAGVQILSGDRKDTLVLLAGRTGGDPADAIAANIAGDLGMAKAALAGSTPAGCLMKGSVHGLPARVSVTVAGDTFMSAASVGRDSRTIGRILESVQGQ